MQVLLLMYSKPTTKLTAIYRTENQNNKCNVNKHNEDTRVARPWDLILLRWAEFTFWKQNGMAKMPTPMMLLANVIMYPVFELILDALASLGLY